MKGDRLRMDPGDYGVGNIRNPRVNRINRTIDENARIIDQVGDADETQARTITRVVPPAAIRLRVSTEGAPSFSQLTGPATPILGRWRRAMMRFYDITPGRGAYLIGRQSDQTRAFADPHSAHRRRLGYSGSVRPARIPHRLLPIETGPGYTPKSWTYGDVKGPPVEKPGTHQGGRVMYSQGVYRRKYRRNRKG